MTSRSFTRSDNNQETTSSPHFDDKDSDADTSARPVQIIFAVDIGSSSTRCSPWVLQRSVDEDQVKGSPAVKSGSSFSFGVKPLSAHAAFNDPTNGQQDEPESVVRSARHVRAIHPDTGRIGSVPLLLDAVDEVVEETLERLRRMSNASLSSSSSSAPLAFEIVGIGFTSFVMNLVGVDDNGEPVDDDRATLCYACNTPEVAAHVKALKRYVRRVDSRRGRSSILAPTHLRTATYLTNFSS